jgi:hypothetical protein
LIIANACEKRSHFFDAAPAFGSALVLQKNFARLAGARFGGFQNLALAYAIAIANIHRAASELAFDSHS